MPLTLFDINDEVKDALANNQAVLSLESTVFAHGMPYPQNLETAKKVVEVIRGEGVVPAIIGIIDGKIKVGLSDKELEFICTSKDIIKVSRRDLPYVVGSHKNGATTVASTMILSHMVGIKVFVTGGIGGVHRGGENTLDISADLNELAKTDVAVVCAGAKAILDIGMTLEFLETRGVPVIGYKSEDFPAFYCRESGFKCDYSIDTLEELAKVVEVKWKMRLKGGVVIANPIPKIHAMQISEINMAISKAMLEAAEKDIIGKEITPFLLERIRQETEGRSLIANIHLLENNALVGAQLAKTMAEMDI
ncbi:pseudouridine-5'-phosphate glycosidase [Sediminitomix flava]|uniref:Pseudouridine-5'-phosphate glycosidase n=1 Tax=Sediminitomix flava TaxID=379075 RepID=A0A315ZIF2_SEDFL|nr:pseudouridine-5'-phosphate glycosidase [Sediminitomix flava]PWJ44494.1 pseudouridine-5'-phosphate glycosidase [Sediminitomix flava]